MKLDRRTVLILTPGFPRNEDDINCLPLQQALVKEMHRQNPSMKIIVVSFQYPWTEQPYQWNGIEVYPFNGHNEGGLKHLLLWRKINGELQKLHKKYKFDNILSFWCGECALIGKRFSKKYKLPHYIWVLGQDARKNNQYMRWIKPIPEQLIALSDSLADELANNYHIRPQHLIVPGIDLNMLPAISTQKTIDLLAAGSLIPLKQFEVFIEVIAAVKKQFPVIRSIICGEGPETKYLQGLIDQKGVSENITLVGELPRGELLEHFSHARIFIHPSSYEGFSMACLEALHCGCSVISFQQPLHKMPMGWDIVKDTEEMKRLALQLLRSGNQTVLQKEFSIEDTARQMVFLFTG